MAWTKKTVIVYNLPPEGFNQPTLQEEIQSAISTQVSEGNTNGMLYYDNNTKSYTRVWLNETTAQAWIDYHATVLLPYNITFKSATIEDNV